MDDPIVAIARPRYVVVWPEDLSPDGKATLGDVNAKLGLQLGAYEGWPQIPSGADLYDYSTATNGAPEFTGCWQTFSPRLECSVTHNGEKVRGVSHKLQLCMKKDMDSYSYAGSRWCDAVQKWQQDLPKKKKYNGFGIIPYSEFVSVYLATSKV